MNRSCAIGILEALSSGVRLDVYRLLVKKGNEGAVAGEIAATLSISPSNLSFHLKVLMQSRLLTVEQEGRFQRYRANMPVMLDMIDYLTAECCAGHPEQCVDVGAGAARLRSVDPPDSPSVHQNVPGRASGNEAEADAAFDRTYRILRARIEALLALPLDELKSNRERLKCELERIRSLLP